MKNIRSFYIGCDSGSGIVFEDKEDFLQYLSEEIDRIEESGEYEHFDITLEPNNYG